MTQMLTHLSEEEVELSVPSWYRRPIGLGDTGPDARVALRKLGLNPDVPYGELAATRVRGIARTLGAYDHDGVLDSRIAAELGEAEITKAGALPEWFCLRLGDHGTTVAAVAQLLGIGGSEFTPDLTDAVRRFQSGRRIEPTGVVDAETAQALGEL